MNKHVATSAFNTALDQAEPAFGKFFMAKFLGLRVGFGEDFCRIDFDCNDYMFNPQGTLHGGVIAFVQDVSMGHLIHHLTGKGGTTLEMKTQFTNRVDAGPVRCEGRFLKRGRQLSFMESRLWNAEDKLAAVSTATWLMPATG